jgi:TM2 domain-containing membrane protein YozV
MTKKKNVALILWFFGLHRFYIGGKPILFLLTVGGLMVWWVLDLFAIIKGTIGDSTGDKLE